MKMVFEMMSTRANLLLTSWLRVLDDLNNGTVFGYMVASPSSRYCSAFTLITWSLLHCSHHYHQVTNPHLFISIVQLHYVIKFKIPSVHVPVTVPLLSAWSDNLIKECLAAEISQFGSFGHGEVAIYSTFILFWNLMTSKLNTFKVYTFLICVMKSIVGVWLFVTAPYDTALYTCGVW